MVNAAKQSHPEKFDVELRPAVDHKAELEKHGISSHGVVCVDTGGKTLWMKADHKLTQDEFDKGLKTVLGAIQ